MTPGEPELPLGERMRARRLSRQVGLRELAQQIGMSPSSLSEFENGKSTPVPRRLAALAAALDVPLDPEPDDGGDVVTDWRVYEPLVLHPVDQAALELFVERGYHGSTMRMIAERAGLSVAGVYHHADGKRDLLIGLLQRAITELIARCEAAAAESPSVERRLTDLARCLVLHHISRRTWAVLSETELRYLEPAERERFIAGRRHVRGLVEDAVRACRAQAGLRAAVPAEQTARAIVTMCVAVADWYDPAGFGPADRVARQYAALARAMVYVGAGPATSHPLE